MLRKQLTVISVISAIAIGLVVAMLTYLSNGEEAKNISSVSGLANLHELARESIAYEVAMNNGKPTLLEFYADWCTTCQGMATSVRELHQQYGERVNLVMLDIDRPQWQQQIKQYRVTGVPQFTFLNERQQVTKTLVGNVPKTVFSNFFKQLTS